MPTTYDLSTCCGCTTYDCGCSGSNASQFSMVVTGFTGADSGLNGTWVMAFNASCSTATNCVYTKQFPSAINGHYGYTMLAQSGGFVEIGLQDIAGSPCSYGPIWKKNFAGTWNCLSAQTIPVIGAPPNDAVITGS